MTTGETLCPHGIVLAPAALKAKYPTACHMPRLDCPHCHGRGKQYLVGATLVYRVLLETGGIPDRKAAWWACICLTAESELVQAAEEQWQHLLLNVLGRGEHGPS